MKDILRTLFAFAVAGTVAGAAGADEPQTSAQPRHFADFHTTGVNRELSHAPIYGTFYNEASAEAYRKMFRENRGLMEWAAKTDFRQQGVVVPVCGLSVLLCCFSRSCLKLNL